jgi:hypothetical protein
MRLLNDLAANFALRLLGIALGNAKIGSRSPECHLCLVCRTEGSCRRPFGPPFAVMAATLRTMITLSLSHCFRKRLFRGWIVRGFRANPLKGVEVETDGDAEFKLGRGL